MGPTERGATSKVDWTKVTLGDESEASSASGFTGACELSLQAFLAIRQCMQWGSVQKVRVQLEYVGGVFDRARGCVENFRLWQR